MGRRRGVSACGAWGCGFWGKRGTEASEQVESHRLAAVHQDEISSTPSPWPKRKSFCHLPRSPRRRNAQANQTAGGRSAFTSVRAAAVLLRAAALVGTRQGAPLIGGVRSAVSEDVPRSASRTPP